MRNLLEYPITHGEVCETLQEAQEAHIATRQIGGTQGLCYLYAEQFIRANSVAFDAFVKAGPKAAE